MTRRQLADALGVHYQTVGYLERGEYNPSLHLALRIAEFFGLPVETIFSTEPFPRISDHGPGHARGSLSFCADVPAGTLRLVHQHISVRPGRIAFEQTFEEASCPPVPPEHRPAVRCPNWRQRSRPAPSASRPRPRPGCG